MEFCFCIGEFAAACLSRVFLDNSSNSVCVFCECILCNCSSIGEMSGSHHERVTTKPSAADVEEGFLFVFYLQFFCFSSAIFSPLACVSRKPLPFCFMFHPLFCILFYFSLFMFCSRKNGVRFVCFCFVSASFFFFSSYFQSIF